MKVCAQAIIFMLYILRQDKIFLNIIGHIPLHGLLIDHVFIHFNTIHFVNTSWIILLGNNDKKYIKWTGREKKSN